jgi:hypothetical protein
LEVAKNGETVPLDDYMHLHSVASKLEERSKTTNVTQLEQELQNKTRALKVAIGLIVLAILLPNLFSLVLTALIFASVVFCGVCYYYQIAPVYQHVDAIFHSIGNIFASVTNSNINLARAKLEADLSSKGAVKRGRSPRRR